MAVKKKIGIVVSNSMQKSIVVEVESRYPHSIYSKTLVKTKKYLAHDKQDLCHIGDQVLIHECRPLSKKKCWTLIEVLSSSAELDRTSLMPSIINILKIDGINTINNLRRYLSSEFSTLKGISTKKEEIILTSLDQYVRRNELGIIL